MDGLRKINDTCNIDSRYLNVPLSHIPDPKGEHVSYAQAMNNKLCGLLDMFNIQHDFISATHCYTSGMFNKYLNEVLKNYDEIMSVVMPTLSKERQDTYSPFLPICPRTKKNSTSESYHKECRKKRNYLH
jgi:lysyl-tRNA synthetase class 1